MATRASCWPTPTEACRRSRGPAARRGAPCSAPTAPSTSPRAATFPGSGDTSAVSGIQRVSPDGKVELLFSEVAGYQLYGPNDLAFGPDGRLYFTESGSEQDFRFDVRVPGRLFAVGPSGAGEMLLELPGVYPNGIAFDAQQRLYWTESMAHRICRLDDRGEPETFCQLSDEHVPDGMAFAADGRLFVATTVSGGVTVISPEGEVLAEIPLGEHATNCTFDGSALYVPPPAGGHRGVAADRYFWRVEPTRPAWTSSAGGCRRPSPRSAARPHAHGLAGSTPAGRGPPARGRRAQRRPGRCPACARGGRRRGIPPLSSAVPDGVIPSGTGHADRGQRPGQPVALADQHEVIAVPLRTPRPARPPRPAAAARPRPDSPRRAVACTPQPACARRRRSASSTARRRVHVPVGDQHDPERALVRFHQAPPPCGRGLEHGPRSAR